MSGSTASVSAEAGATMRTGQRELVVSVNWIGDAIMAMPALQVYRRLHPDKHLALLARGALADLWALHPAPDEIIRYDGRPGIFHPLYDQLRAGHFNRAWILPNSFRAAWMAFRSGIPRRAGYVSWLRGTLINEPFSPMDDASAHQSLEYLRMLAPGEATKPAPRPELRVPHEIRVRVREKWISWQRPAIGLIPGAARGPAKRWPAEHFIALGGKLVRDGYDLVFFGSREDVPLINAISSAIGSHTHNLAGQTTIVEWAALLESCRLVVANDSGGMHLAAALGRPVIALYGLTDPTRTGPLGETCTILQHSLVRSRDIARVSEEAIKSLASIRPEAVYEAAQVQLRTAASMKTPA